MISWHFTSTMNQTERIFILYLTKLTEEIQRKLLLKWIQCVCYLISVYVNICEIKILALEIAHIKIFAQVYK